MSEKVSVWVAKDERYPEYLLTDEPGFYETEVKVDAETLARWRAAIEAFNRVQDEIHERYNATRYPKGRRH